MTNTSDINVDMPLNKFIAECGEWYVTHTSSYYLASIGRELSAAVAEVNQDVGEHWWIEDSIPEYMPEFLTDSAGNSIAEAVLKLIELAYKMGVDLPERLAYNFRFHQHAWKHKRGVQEYAPDTFTDEDGAPLYPTEARS